MQNVKENKQKHKNKLEKCQIGWKNTNIEMMTQIVVIWQLLIKRIFDL